jgi:hypothetical protein
VLDPGGQPLNGASVNMCPNQSLGRATSIIGARHKSEDVLEAKDMGSIDKLRKKFEMPRFCSTTDASGVAVISGLPTGKHRIFVSTSDFDCGEEKFASHAVRTGLSSSEESKHPPKSTWNRRAAHP